MSASSRASVLPATPASSGRSDELPDESGDPLRDERLARVCQRPDGYHWLDPDSHQEFGPFETLQAALDHMDAPSDTALDLAELAEATELVLEIEPQLDRLDEDEPGAPV